MKRDVISTIGGLVVVAAIIGATFWYGNHQRKTELASVTKVAAQATAAPHSAPTFTPKPTTKPTSTSKMMMSPTPKPQPTVIPQTGPSTMPVLALGSIVIAATFWQFSRRSLVLARRSIR